MKTKKKQLNSRPETFIVGEDATDKSKPLVFDIDSAEPKRERFQLSFDLNEDGSPDMSAIRDRTKEKVRAFFSDPRMASAFGAKPPEASVPALNLFPMGPDEKYPLAIGSFYNVLGMVEVFCATKVGKIPEPVARQAFTYSPQEIEVLSPITVKVFNKYLPLWLIKYQDEIALGSLLISMFITKANFAAQMARQMAQTGTTQPGSQAKSEENAKKDEVVQ